MTEKRFVFDDSIIWKNTGHNSRFEIFPSKAVTLLNELSEENDEIYDTANKYGQYNKILDKRELIMLLNEYNTFYEELEK